MSPNRRIICIFATAYKRKVSGKQEKHCDTVLTFKVRQIYEEGRAFMLSLDVYAIGSCLGISTGVRYVRIPHFLKGVWRYLNVNGHEHISLMPFFIVLTPVGDLGQNVIPHLAYGQEKQTLLQTITVR